MSQFEKISGKIDKVYNNATSKGQPYMVVQLDDGERFSLWRKGDFDKVSKGDSIEFDYSTKGNFKNIERIYDVFEEVEPGPPGNGPDAVTPMNGKYNGTEPGNGNRNEYGADKLDRVVRMSGLKSAAQIVAACGTKMPFEMKVDKTLEAARMFRDYILGDDEFGLEPPEPLEPSVPA